jgi:FkbM family methyltransferase
MAIKKIINRILKKIGYRISKISGEIKIQEIININKSWAQEGEDLILKRYFEHKQIGFYVDVGAHDPFRFSNTYKFYREGWTGLNIDANPDKQERFKVFRPKDKFIIAGVSNEKSLMEFYRFDEGALNTFDIRRKQLLIEDGWKLKDVINVHVRTLNEILVEAEVSKIDFITVDVEGFDLKVLQGIDLYQFKPEIIAVEGLDNTEKNAINEYLIKYDYKKIASTVNTMFFRNNYYE